MRAAQTLPSAAVRARNAIERNVAILHLSTHHHQLQRPKSQNENPSWLAGWLAERSISSLELALAFRIFSIRYCYSFSFPFLIYFIYLFPSSIGSSLSWPLTLFWFVIQFSFRFPFAQLVLSPLPSRFRPRPLSGLGCCPSAVVEGDAAAALILFSARQQHSDNVCFSLAAPSYTQNEILFFFHLLRLYLFPVPYPIHMQRTSKIKH